MIDQDFSICTCHECHMSCQSHTRPLDPPDILYTVQTMRLHNTHAYHSSYCPSRHHVFQFNPNHFHGKERHHVPNPYKRKVNLSNISGVTSVAIRQRSTVNTGSLITDAKQLNPGWDGWGMWHVWDRREMHCGFCEETEGRRPIGRSSCNGENGMGVNYIRLAQDRHVAGSCEQGNEAPDFIYVGRLLE